MNPKGFYKDNTIVMFEHGAFDSVFSRLYDEGMALIEKTAAYIDGDGKIASRKLSGEASSLYASEAMRMSTRLMQVASWLLLFRAARDKEMSQDQVNLEKAKVSLNTPSLGSDNEHWNELPDTFRQLIGASIRLEERVRHMDQDLENALTQSKNADNSVSNQLDRLKAAFHFD